MTSRHVTADGAARCPVCSGPLPPPPARGGTPPTYCRQACRQAAYRERAAGRHVTADDGSAAGLIAAVRAVAAALDAGTRPDPERVTAVRAGVADLLARVDAARHVTAPEPGAGPDDTESHRETGRHVTAVDTTPDDPPSTDDTMAAAVAAVARLGPDAHTVDSDNRIVAADGTYLGLVRRGLPRQWDAWLPGMLPVPGSGRTVHRTRTSAVAAVLLELARRANDRHVTDAPRTGGRRSARPRRRTGSVTGADMPVPPALDAAVRAVADVHVGRAPIEYARDGDGWTVVYRDTPVGTLRPSYGARGARSGWQALTPGATTPIEGRHDTRRAAAVALLVHLKTVRLG